ncbi:substrate-binding domain-containing protein [Fluviicola sp.]|jgi:ABC-type nitrate/sulfonate/bicarbonate transport system substrate-binding protein|uniref:substrate-binding domain-containing protein n=1 Tax=Fluviicola sp. TaxID=1917219 RepID=UPI00281A6B66|nr:substrate-binding domain-containing protein [Fluviicola sp.]MDR0801662.1 ABC transporter substrate-binding protein [Fluviicola sp.]
MTNETGLKIGGVPEHFNLPWRLAIEEGKFQEIGLNLHWSDMSGGTGQMIRGLETGSIDIAVLLTEGITKSILQGLDAKILEVYVVSPLSWGIHVPNKGEIKKPEDVENQTFAISRYGSGSHLMAYVMADQYAWNLEDLKFNVIGDVYGGLWALKHNEAQAFLWEKYTTFPFVEQGKCDYVGDVVTPWPCFVVAVRSEVAEKHEELLKQMCKVVNQKALEVKNHPDSAEIISWRYNLRLDQVKRWLSETDWNYKGIEYPLAFEKTTHYLKKLNLLSEEEAENWRSKLFI